MKRKPMNDFRKRMYANAGIVYGQLLDELGFGKLSMHNKQYGICYQWRFNSSKGRFGAEHTIDNSVLGDHVWPTDIAIRLARQWKHQIQSAQEASTSDT